MSKQKTDRGKRNTRLSDEELLTKFRDSTIKHRSINAAYQQAVATLGCPAGPRVVMVTGPTGVGKTTVARALWRRAMEQHRSEAEQDTSCVPVIGINAVPPNGASFNWKDFYIRLLERHGDILVDKKLLVSRQAEIFPELPTASRLERSVGDALRRSVESCLQYRKTRILIIDEAHHLLMVNNERRLQFQFETLKSLTIETDVVIVLVGTYRLLDIRDQSGQLVRRSEIIHFPRYDMRQRTDVQAFASVLASLQARMPLEKEPCLVDDVEYFYLKTGGCIGILKDWLTRCLAQALAERRKTIDARFADQFALSNKSLRTIIEEAMVGEEKLRDVDADSVETLLREGIRMPRAGGTSTTTRGRSGGRGHVGERHPKRDPVGGAHAAR